MKTRARLLSLLLVLVIACSSLVSCNIINVSFNENENTTDNADNTEKDTENPNILILFKDGKYQSKVVISESATEPEKAVYTKLRAALKEKTQEATTYCTDFISFGQTRDPNETAILVGNTNYDESKEASANTPYGNYALNVIGNKLIMSFTSKDEGFELVNIISKSIKTDGNGTYWIQRKLSVSKEALPQLQNIPRYPSDETVLADCSDSTAMIVANHTTLDTFKSYCSTLEQNEYVLYTSREDVNGNYFNTYTKGSLALTVYFTPSSKTTRIISGPIKDIPTKEVDNTPETVTPSLTLVNQSEKTNNGLGLIYLLPNGKFLIIDGGYSRGDNIYDILCELAPDKDNIVITAWYISHQHSDHQQALASFVRAHKEDVKIESVLFNYTTTDQYNAVTTGPDGAANATSLRTILSQYLSKETKIIKPHSGQVYNYGSTKVEIMYTVEDVMPQTLDYLNTSSLVVRVTMDNHSMLALADTTHISSNILRDRYGSYLKSDMVQLAHHGIWPGYASLYETVKAEVLIWPTNMSNAKSQISNSAVAASVKYAVDVYISNQNNITIKLPYTYINNKQQFLESIGKG